MGPAPCEPPRQSGEGWLLGRSVAGVGWLTPGLPRVAWPVLLGEVVLLPFAPSCLRKHVSLATSMSEQLKEAPLRVSLLDLPGHTRPVSFRVSVLEMGKLRLAGVSLGPLR